MPSSGPSSPAVERRAFPRFSCGLETSCLPTTAIGDTPWPVRIRNLSAGGVGLVLGRWFEPGKLLIVLLPAEGREASRMVQARVLRTTKQPNSDWFLGCALLRELADDELRAWRRLSSKPTVLVVDDEAPLRTLLDMGLCQHGFRVLQAGGGEEAVAVYREHGDEIDLVLLDIQMPDLDGPRALARIQEINPSVRACFMSGNLGPYTEEDLLRRGAQVVIRKPFHFTEVAQALRQVAGSAGPVSAPGKPN
jgi:CheY-like chemotaxis protein